MLWKTLIFCSQLPTCWTWRHYSDTQASSTLQPEMSKPNATALVTFFALLLLTMFPQQTIAGRQYLPAGPPASSMHTPRPVQVPAARRVASQGGVLEGSALDDGSQFQDRTPPSHRKIFPGFKDPVNSNADSIYGHRLLVGSSPPTCQGKCGRCIPCSPIHMSYGSPHGALTQQEYYPEVWRCKCGNRYFMP